jgi:dCMP deaminase
MSESSYYECCENYGTHTHECNLRAQNRLQKHMRDTRDEYYLKMLALVAGRSTCGRRLVGAIITDEAGHVLSTGYNGTPIGIPHCTEVACDGRFDPPGDSSRCLSVHAEQNVLLQCTRLDLAYNLYISCTPCFVCAKLIVNTPIKRVICQEAYADVTGLWLLAQRGIKLIYNPTDLI